MIKAHQKIKLDTFIFMFSFLVTTQYKIAKKNNVMYDKIKSEKNLKNKANTGIEN